jgi:hypothetical protein
MTRTLIGFDSLGIPCVKVTKGTINPRTEPDANVGSFYYNSKWAKDVKLVGMTNTPYTGGNYYIPSGSTSSNYQKSTYVPASGAMIVAMRNTFFGSALPYSLPLWDMKVRKNADNHYVEQYRSRRQGSEDPSGREPGYYTTWDRGRSAWWANRGDDPEFPYRAMGNGLFYYANMYGENNADQVTPEIVVWRLPGNNVAIQNGSSGSPSAGQRVVEITENFCRVAKPGFDTRTATATQLAFDSSGRPLAAIKSGDISLPIGTTQIELGYAVDPTTICDMVLYTGSTIVFPMSQFGESLICEYWFSGTKLFISNNTRACRCRYIVFANDKLSTSSGANKVLRQFNDGTEDVVQFLRPGAAATPRFADIVLDSRWPAIQILAEGYQAIGSQPNYTPPGSINAGQSFTVNFPNTGGVFPFVKYMTVHDYGSNGILVRPPMSGITENYNNQAQYHMGNSTYCTVTSNQATFWTFKGNPEFERYTSGWTFDYPADPIIGIRYYILGLPT